MAAPRPPTRNHPQFNPWDPVNWSPIGLAVKDAGGGNAVSGIKKAASAAEFLANPNNWVRVGEGLVGVLLIGIGVSAMLRATPTGQSVMNAVGMAAGPVKAAGAARGVAKRAAVGTQQAATRAHAVETARQSARAAAKGAR